MATFGGKREGAGRPLGSKNRATLEKQAILEAFNQRVMNKADALFDAQLSLAVGSAQVFRIDEEVLEGGKTKRVHALVTNAEEIKELLDQHDGGNGEVDGKFYYFTTVLPDNKAIEAMLNRALGKAPEKIIASAESPLSTDTLTALKTLARQLSDRELSDDDAAKLLSESFTRAGIDSKAVN